MKDYIASSWESIKPLIPWTIAGGALIIFIILLIENPTVRFYIGSAFIMLLILLYEAHKEIGSLEKEVKNKDTLFRALDQNELIRAIKKVEENSE